MWSFARINGRLSELFFNRRRSRPFIIGHCYVKESEYKTEREKRYIRLDTEKYRFTYRNGKYFDQKTKKEVPIDAQWLKELERERRGAKAGAYTLEKLARVP